MPRKPTDATTPSSPPSAPQGHADARELPALPVQLPSPQSVLPAPGTPAPAGEAGGAGNDNNHDQHQNNAITATNAQSGAGIAPLRSAKHEAFAHAYVALLNATEAYLAAYPGVTRQTAGRNGHKLLKNARISERIRCLQHIHTTAVGLSAEGVLRELAILGASDVTNYTIDPGTGQLAPAEGCGPEVMRAVKSIKHKKRVIFAGQGAERRVVEEIYEVDFRLWDKPTALRLVGQKHGLFSAESDGPGNLSVFQVNVYVGGKRIGSGRDENAI